MTYENALEKIHSLLTFGSRPGLDRIKALLELMGNPQDKLRFIHVAGTNGKGSVCQFLSSVLIKQGYKTGLFISPYITDFRERIQINGEMITRDTLVNAVENTYPLLLKLRESDCIITEFEYVMALEFYIHSNAGCDVVVLETGMGGLLDCTNVIRPPLCSVITTVGLDHTAVLGNTVEEIALQKCGIIKKGSLAVTSMQEPPVMEIIEKTAAEKSVPLYKSSDVKVRVISADIERTVLDYNGIRLVLNLPGEHQVENAKTAVAALRVLNQRGILSVSADSIQNGFAAAKNPARFELMCNSPRIILDGAHNPNGINALAKSLKTLDSGNRRICILGMLRDKDSLSSVKLLQGLFDEIVCVAVNNPRTLTAEELAEECKGRFKTVTTAENPEKAFDYALKRAEDEGLTAVVCGSLYLCGEIRPYIIKRMNKN